MNVIVDAAWLMLHCDGSADDLVRLVRARFPGISDDEISAAAAEMKALATSRRDHIKSEIEAGRYAGRKDTIQ
jgi:hypothetical protein